MVTVDETHSPVTLQHLQVQSLGTEFEREVPRFCRYPNFVITQCRKGEHYRMLFLIWTASILDARLPFIFEKIHRPKHTLKLLLWFLISRIINFLQ